MSSGTCVYCLRNRALHQCGKKCGAIYCGQYCANNDWRKHILICGKSGENESAASGKRERGEEPCRNERDPITMDEFEGMDPEEIIFIGRDCFHLPSLYAWVVNRGNNKNPLTGLPFSETDMALLNDEARRRFPLRVHVRSLTGAGPLYETTSLMDPLALIHLVHPQSHTLFQFMNNLSRENILFIVENPYWMPGESHPNMIRWADAHEHAFIKDLGMIDKGVLKVSLHRALSPQQQLALNRLYRDIAMHREWPTAYFDEFIAETERFLEDNARARDRADVIRADRLRREGPPQAPPPVAQGMRRVTVNLNTEEGHAYGTFWLDVPEDALVGSLSRRIRDRFVDAGLPIRGLDQEDPQFTYVFAGRIYAPHTSLSNLPNFGNGSVLHVTPRRQLH